MPCQRPQNALRDAEADSGRAQAQAMGLLFDGLPVTAADALTLLSRHELRRLAAQGAVRRIFHGVYVDAQVEDTLALRAAAAALVVPPGSILARQDAAMVWGVPRQEAGADRRRHSTTLRPEEATGLRRAGVLGRVAVLPEDDVVSVGDLQLTSPARTLLDLARWLERPDALAYADALRRATQVEPDELHDGLDRLVGFARVAQPGRSSLCRTRRRNRPASPGCDCAGWTLGSHRSACSTWWRTVTASRGWTGHCGSVDSVSSTTASNTTASSRPSTTPNDAPGSLASAGGPGGQEGPRPRSHLRV